MNIGYAKLRDDYIAELEILGKTNENRQDIVDPQYAEYRTSKVKVLKIFHMSETQVNGEVNNVTQVIEQINEYVVGKEIHASNEDINYGIRYFKTLEPAKMWHLCVIVKHLWNISHYTGKDIGWLPNGSKIFEIEYKDGEEEGKCTWWYPNGKKEREGEFKGGKIKGKCTGWYDNGNKKYEGEQEGKWIEWYENGTIKCEGEEYHDRNEDRTWFVKKEGKHLGWYDNCNKEYEGEYKNGKKEGKWIEWYEDGTKKYEGEYKDGIQI